MRLELFGNDLAGKSYLLNEIGIGVLIVLIIVNVYGIYLYKNYKKSKSKILVWGAIIDLLLVIGLILRGVVIRTTFQ